MNTRIISLESKKRYLKWILKNKKLKESEFEHFIVYLINNDSFLENIHFSADVNSFNHSLTLCCTDFAGESVIYKKDKFISFEKQYAFKEVYRQNNEPLYIHFLYDSFLFCDELEKVECELAEESYLSEEVCTNVNYLIDMLELGNKKRCYCNH